MVITMLLMNNDTSVETKGIPAIVFNFFINLIHFSTFIFLFKAFLRKNTKIAIFLLRTMKFFLL